MYAPSAIANNDILNKNTNVFKSLAYSIQCPSQSPADPLAPIKPKRISIVPIVFIIIKSFMVVRGAEAPLG